MQRAEHAKAEQVELHESCRGAVVLVPLQHAAALHAGPLHRAYLDDRPVADDHATRMDTEMTGEVLYLRGEVEHRVRDVVGRGAIGVPLCCRRCHRSPRIDLLAPRILLAGGEPECTRHVPHARARPVGDDIGHLCRMVAAVARIRVLDDLLATVRLDVDVNVWRAITLRRQEALEEQSERHRIGLGDAERVAHCRVRSAAAALAVDVLPSTELDEIPHHEEVTGKAELLDDAQFTVDGCPRAGAQRRGFVRERSLAVAAARALLGDMAQVLHLVHAGGARVRGQLRRDEREVKRCGAAEVCRRLHHTGVAGEASRLLRPGAEVGERGGGQPRVEVVETAA